VEIEGFDIDVILDVITPELLWEARFEEYQRHLNSNKLYGEMSLDEKNAITLRLKKAIGIMYDTVDDWLPDSLSLSEDGTCLRIEFNLILNKVEIDVDRMHKATTFKLREMRQEIENLLDEEQ
jgi:hypothetical protein